MRISEICIERPVFATVLSLIITLIGLVSLSKLSIREYPRIDEPVVTVSTEYRGASPEIIESQVTKPLEDSIAGIEGQAGQLAYGTAKAAILGMTLPLARDLAPVGIRVCGIAPGTMFTPIMASTREEMRAELTKNIQFPKRMGKPEEFAELVEMIARNGYLNGENIRLDGALRFPPK